MNNTQALNKKDILLFVSNLFILNIYFILGIIVLQNHNANLIWFLFMFSIYLLFTIIPIITLIKIIRKKIWGFKAMSDIFKISLFYNLMWLLLSSIVWLAGAALDSSAKIDFFQWIYVSAFVSISVLLFITQKNYSRRFYELSINDNILKHKVPKLYKIMIMGLFFLPIIIFFSAVLVEMLFPGLIF